jgi:hypothetical protein
VAPHLFRYRRRAQDVGAPIVRETSMVSAVREMLCRSLRALLDLASGAVARREAAAPPLRVLARRLQWMYGATEEASP